MHIGGTVFDENWTWKTRFSLIKSKYLKPPKIGIMFMVRPWFLTKWVTKTLYYSLVCPYIHCCWYNIMVNNYPSRLSSILLLEKRAVKVRLCSYDTRTYPDSFCASTETIPDKVSVHTKERLFRNNRPLALRGHVTNASFKQWVWVLLMPKIVKAHKNYLKPEIWEETYYFKGDILWHFDFSAK